MKKVKGSLMVMVVKAIKASRSKWDDFNRILSDKAKEVLDRRVLVASWYPFELYKECIDALMLIEARNNPKTLVQWGHAEGKRSLTTIYRATITKGDIETAVEAYSRLYRMLFNFGEVETKIISDNEATFTFKNFINEWQYFYYITVGWIQEFIELATSKKTEYTFLNKSWVGEGWTTFKISWPSD
ncbi:MAG: hypothetical protein ACFFA0_12090 [Promethearchaeota archaeon]